MPRVIFKCPYLKGGSGRAASHLHNYVRYMATREGAQRITPANKQLPATRKQQEMVDQLLRDFPLSRGMFEYEDYQTAPTRANASEFITRALEDNYDQITKRDNYVSYIASRPRAQRTGSHALFTGSDDPLVLSRVADEVARHPGNVWLPIISLRREDAARLGYDDAERWKELLTGYAVEMAEAMKIPWEQFRWYAAFHDESHHPHVHMVCYSADGRSGYLTRDGIARIKSDLAQRIFRQELHELYEQQTQRRDRLTQEAGAVIAELVRQMRDGTLENPKIEQLMEHLAGKLKTLSGKRQYGYLKAPLKSVVDEIVDELARDERVVRAYELWYELREEVLRTYKEDLPPRLPLSKQKEFKRIRNIVIEEALRLSDDAAVFDPTAPEADLDEEAFSEQFESSMETGDTGKTEEQINMGVARKIRSSPNFQTSWTVQYLEARRFLFGGEGRSPDFDRAFALFLEEARTGNALAMCDLGRMFEYGLDREKDMEQAQTWYAKALHRFFSMEAQKPSRYVEYRIGKLYASGRGTEQDHLSAVDWFTKSAEQDFPYAAYELGKMYRDGHGVEKDALRAAAWFAKAAEQDNGPAVCALARLLLTGGEGLAKDVPAAVRWLRRSAEAGNQFAQCHLGKLLLQCEDVPKDITEALRWLTTSAEQGSQYAQYALGKIYLLGKDTLRDQKTAGSLSQRRRATSMRNIS